MNNQTEFEVLPLFSHPLYRSSVGDISQKYIEIAKNCKYTYIPSGMFYVSELEDDQVLDYFPDLRLKVLDHVKNYIHNVLRISYDQKFKFSNSWLTKFPPNSHTPSPHMHCFSLFSGVVYLDSKDRGGITFSFKRDSGSIKTMTFDFPLIKENSFNIFNSEDWTINPVDGDILLFPSSMKHSVNVNTSDRDRYSIAFNVVPIGNIGIQQTGKLYYE